MKEGSFDSSIQDIDFDESLTLKSVPLPTERPERMDLSQFPEKVLRSRAIESLISQNDDLMSRLGVSLRRIASLEEKLSDTEKESQQFRSQYENLKDQVLILKEKSRLLSERQGREESEYQNLKNQIRVLEIRYAELYSASQTKEANLLKKLNQFSKVMGRQERYQRRLKTAAESIKSKYVESQKLEKKLAEQEISINSIRKNLTESAEYISKINKEHRSEIEKLTSNYEEKISSFKRDISSLQTEKDNLARRCEDFDKTLQEKVRLENELILSVRKHEDYRIQVTAETADLQKGLARYRNESNDLALKVESFEKENNELQAKADDTLAENKALCEQVENLQTLWRDNQSKLEKTEERNRSLQKLNQELSITLNQYRRDIRQLKERLDALELQSSEKASSKDAAERPPKQNHTDLENKIDRLLDGLHGKQ
jgi:chromosome segregation ATPase